MGAEVAEVGFGALASSLPPLIVSGPRLTRLERLAAFVPTGARALGIECRLHDACGPVDLGAGFVQGRTSAQRLLGKDRRWQSISDFFELWDDPGCHSSKWIPFVFLEFDADSTDPPVPSVFAALDSPLGEAPSRGTPELAAAGELAEILLRGSFRAEQSSVLERCFTSLRGHARVLHVAVMLGRPVQSIRTSIWIRATCAGRYLREIGGVDTSEQLESLLAALPDRPAELQLDFDLGPPIAPRLGLGHRPAGRGEWVRTLEHFVGRGLCDADVARSLLAWQAEHSAREGPHRAELSHVKLARGPDGVVEAKCYLGMTIRSEDGSVEADLTGPMEARRER